MVILTKIEEHAQTKLDFHMLSTYGMGSEQPELDSFKKIRHC